MSLHVVALALADRDDAQHSLQCIAHALNTESCRSFSAHTPWPTYHCCPGAVAGSLYFSHRILDRRKLKSLPGIASSSEGCSHFSRYHAHKHKSDALSFSRTCHHHIIQPEACLVLISPRSLFLANPLFSHGQQHAPHHEPHWHGQQPGWRCRQSLPQAVGMANGHD